MSSQENIEPPEGPSRAKPAPPMLHEVLFDAEEHHFWFRSRGRVIAAVFKSLARGMPRNPRILEVGCNTGHVLREIQGACPDATLVGMDLSFGGLPYAARRTSGFLLQADAAQPPFMVRFNAAGIFDVIEHIKEDEEVLRDMRNLLEPGGALVVTVPARHSLWSYHDVTAGHVRRYEAAELRNKLESAGFRVEFLSPFMTGIYPMVWLHRLLVQRHIDQESEDALLDQAKSDVKVQPLLNAFLSAMLAPEAWLLPKGIRLPFGTSLLAVARNV